MKEKIVLVSLGQKFDTNEIRDKYYSSITDSLRNEGFDISVDNGSEYDAELTVNQLSGVDGVIFSSNGPMSRAVMEQLPKLKFIMRYGIGLNSVDLDAATEMGKIVCYTPGYCSEEIAIHAIALALASIRNIPYYDRKLRKGIWLKGNGPVPRRPRNLVMGIFALGASGSIVAKVLHNGFGSRVIACDPYAKPENAKELGVEMVNFDQLLRQSDIVFINAPLTPETKHIFNDEAFSKMKDGSILINVSRGGIVEMEALCRALDSGKIAKAALDVFEREPPPSDAPFMSHDHVIVTPHSAYYGQESIDTANFLISRITKRLFRDKILYRRHVANPAVLEQLKDYTVLDSDVD